MVSLKIADSKEQSVICESAINVETPDAPKTTPKLAKPKPMDVKRRCTDVFWFFVFAILYTAWLGLIVYVAQTRQMYNHDINANHTSADDQGVADCDAPKDNWSSLLRKGTSMVFEALCVAWREACQIFLLDIFAMLVIGIPLILIIVTIAEFVCKYLPQLPAIAWFCLLLSLKAFWMSMIVYIGCYMPNYDGEMLLPLFIAMVISMQNYTIYSGKDFEYENHISRRMRPYLRCSFRFKLTIVLMIVSFIALTVASVQFTGPFDPLRGVILVGGFYIVRFLLTFANMTIAQAVATYHRTPKEDADMQKSSMFNYAGIVIRYHLGTVAFSTLNVFSVLQSLYITLRHGFVPIKKGGNVIYSLFQKIYLVFNAADYGTILTAANGSSHYESTKTSTVLLSRYCAMSSVAMFRGLDTILKCAWIIVTYQKVIMPISEYGFDYLPIPRTLYTDDLSIWILIGIFASIGCVFSFILQSNSMIIQASRICLLEDKVQDKKTYKRYTLEFTMCFDMWFIEKTSEWYFRSVTKTNAKSKKATIAEDNTKIEKIDVEKNLEAVRSIVEGRTEFSF